MPVDDADSDGSLWCPAPNETPTPTSPNKPSAGTTAQHIARKILVSYESTSSVPKMRRLQRKLSRVADSSIEILHDGAPCCHDSPLLSKQLHYSTKSTYVVTTTRVLSNTPSIYSRCRVNHHDHGRSKYSDDYAILIWMYRME